MDKRVYNITIIQRILPHYRIPFFVALCKRLQHDGIALNLIYGQEYPGAVPKTRVCYESWAHRIENHYLRIAGKELVWQPCLNRIKNSDLIIIEQSSRLLLNYPILFGLLARRSKVAYWGHGKNLQAGKRSWHELLKHLLVRKVDWWFAYSRVSAGIVAKKNFPLGKITVVQNTIEATELTNALDKCPPEDVHALRTSMGITSENVALYCGGMYEFKKLDFLILSAVRIREQVPDFHLVLIGDGPDQSIIKGAAEKYEWIHYVGPKFGRELAPYYKISKIFLMPGAVGLAIIDNFIAGIPLFTTDIPTHGPEIAYLENGVNGVMTSCSENSYTNAVTAYLKDKSLQKRLREGCKKSAALYSNEAMVENFTVGIKRCLGIS